MAEEKPPVRGFRKAIEIATPMVGILVVFAGVLLVPASQLQNQVMVVLLGVLMIEAGAWGVTASILPNGRQYTALREEGDRFIGLVRRLNEARIRDRVEPSRESARLVRGILDDMHASVDVMGEVAGREHPRQAAQKDAPTRR